jgi:hypothetical protein
MANLELENATLHYWALSRNYNGHSPKEVPTHRALKMCNRLISNYNPQRPLVQRTMKLRADIIYGMSRDRTESAAVINIRA